MDVVEIKKMSIAERLQAMEALWNSFLYEGEEISSPAWHEQILKERKKKLANGKAKFLPIEELKASRRH